MQIIAPSLNNYNKQLSDQDFYRLSDFIYSNYGIKMPIAKKTMLQSRLQGRLRANNFENFTDYVNFIFSGPEANEEIVKMVDAVSTNKTDFFREQNHFNFMRDKLLPEFPADDIKIWSAASSSGEEIYSIAIELEEFAETRQNFKYSIVGTDISTRILEKAATAVYPEERISGIPFEIRRKYFLKSKNRENPTVKVIPEIRRKTEFRRLNLMDDFYSGIKEDFDIIFCRNVLIYFDRGVQESVINKLCRHLKKGGYFFLGHSESITGIETPLKQVSPTIFIKT